MSDDTGSERVLADRYQLLEQLGRGGMGVVWRARDLSLGREVAIKEVRAPADLDERQVRQLHERLEREGRAAALVAHRNVVTVYDVVTEEDRPWIVMELVRGVTLADQLEAEGPLPPRRVAAIGAELVEALGVAHDAGVLHRDVKPGNVIIGDDGRVVLTDFGIALVRGTSTLTLTGELVGSAEYLSPERAMGGKQGPEGDVWSLGVTLFAAVEGRTPFRLDTPLSTLRAVVDDELPEPRRAGPLAPVLEGLLRKDPAQRLSTLEAEGMLRLVAAGGTPRVAPAGQGGAAGVDAPTVVTRPAAETGAAGAGSAGAVGASGGSGAAPTVPDATPQGASSSAKGPAKGQGRRTLASFAAGALAAALILAAVAWTLTDDETGGGARAGGGATPGYSTGGKETTEARASKNPAKTPEARTTPHHTSDDRPASAGTTGQPPTSDTPPPGGDQSVMVELSAVRDYYSGLCPPPAAEAPHFSAVITIGSAPATVTYRWVTGSGMNSDPGWKTAEFDSTQMTVEHTETSHQMGGTHEDWIALEVKSPEQATSDQIGFVTECLDDDPSTPGPSALGGVDGGPA